MLVRIITTSAGMVDYSQGVDDELDAALILSGYEQHTPRGRYCFQTTYLNECYQEYFSHRSRYKIVWMLRNPYSVVYSLVYNWRRFALNELFVSCGLELLSGRPKKLYDHLGLIAVSRLQRACLSYTAKISQVFHIVEGLGASNVLVVDYDELVQKKTHVLPMIYDFIGLPCKPSYLDMISDRSLYKARRLSRREQALIGTLCLSTYQKASELITY